MFRSMPRALAVLVGVAVALAGCATPAAPPAPSVGPPALEHPRRAAPDPIVVESRERLAAMTLEQKIAGMLMLHVAGTDPAAIRATVDRYAPGGIILMGDNTVGDVGGVQAITSVLHADPALPLLVGIDQEGGEVSRLASDPAPGAEALRSGAPEATAAAFQARASLLAAAGVSVNFGVVADVTDDPGSFLAGRVLGTDPAASAAQVAAAVAGEHGTVLSTLKHFPGHGAAPGDSHATIPVAGTDHPSWLARDAVPFQAGIDAGAELVMFGHLRFPAVDAAPASLSGAWHGILRDELDYDGVTITDDLDMLPDSGDPAFASRTENAIAAIAAGNTMLLFVAPPDPASFDPAVLVADIAAAVRAGRIPESTVDRAAIMLLRLRLGLGSPAR